MMIDKLKAATVYGFMPYEEGVLIKGEEMRGVPLWLQMEIQKKLGEQLPRVNLLTTQDNKVTFTVAITNGLLTKKYIGIQFWDNQLYISDKPAEWRQRG
jgi:hypothetical protein